MQPIDATSALPPKSADDSRLDQVIEEIVARLHAGEVVTAEECEARYPDCANELAPMLPGLQAMVRFGDSGGVFAEDAATPGAITAKVLGDYRVLREVGRGGMGVVYEAEQITLSRRVALKILPFAAVLDPRHLQRFKNEAMAAAHLDHPNIVEVYGIGCERSIHFYAMRFVEGVTLSEVVEAKKRSQATGATDTAKRLEPNRQDAATEGFSPSIDSLSGTASASLAVDTSPALQAALSTVNSVSSKERFRRIAEIGIQAAEALDHAHQMGIVHRDIKPSNLMLDERGKLWVTDFGLARSQGDASMTMTGDLVGTLRYMSPEQALAKRITVDHRTDIYSLGVTLYELLTLRAAFPSNDREETLRQIAFEETTSPRKLDKSIPEELETIILKAMEKNPEDRYATAREVAEDLKRWVEHKPIAARAPGVVMKTKKWMRRHPGTVCTCVGCTGVLLAGLIVALWAVTHEQSKTRAALGQATLAATQKAVALSDATQQRDTATRNLYLADMRQAFRDWERGQTKSVLKALARHRPEGNALDLRGWEWYCLLSLCNQHACEFTLEAPVSHLVWSNQGLLACGTTKNGTGTTDVWSIDKKSRVVRLPNPDGGILRVSWVADDKLRTVDTHWNGRLWQLPAGDVEREIKWEPVKEILADQNDRLVPTGESEDLREFRIIDRQTNETHAELVGGFDRSWTALSPVGDSFVTCSRGDSVVLWKIDPHTKECQEVHRWNAVGDVHAVAWSPDGNSIASGCYTGDLYVWNSKTLDLIARKKHIGAIREIAWSSDGARLGVATSASTAIAWDTTTWTVSQTLRGHGDGLRSLAWSRDGKRLATGDYSGVVKVWDTTSASDERIAAPSFEPCDVRWSTDDRLLILESRKWSRNS